MIRSVQRAFRLLEALDAAGRGGASLSSLSATCDIKPPTAHNILATLVELGYAKQDGATRCYALGSRVRGLGTGRAALSHLCRAAEDAVAALHEALNETVILTVDMGGKRHSILSRESGHALKVGATTGEDDHFFDTATGRVLLALRNADEVSRLVEARGLPGDLWPEVGTRRGLQACLASIREAGYACVDKRESHIRALAVPVTPPGFSFRVALGLYYPTVRRETPDDESLVAQLQRAAQEIEHEFERM